MDIKIKYIEGAIYGVGIAAGMDPVRSPLVFW